MADRLRAAAEHLARRLLGDATREGQACRDVVYSRGATSLAIKAAKGGVLLKLSDPLGNARTLRTQDDYVVRASDLAELGEPQERDLVQDQLEGKAYLVLSPGGEEAAWRYTDQTHVLIRLHTKEAPGG